LPKNIVSFSEIPGFSRLFQDFISHSEHLDYFFGSELIAKKIECLNNYSFPRRTAADILMRQNQSWKAPKQVLSAIEKLRDPKAVAVFTGQQAGLFSGPYLTILKALAAIKEAARLEKEMAVPVVPIFWIDADDHDYEEISSIHLFNREGKLSRLSIDDERKGHFPPIGSLTYGDSIEKTVRQLISFLPDNDFKEEAISPIKQSYLPGKRIVDCFAEYVMHLIGHLGLPLFNPYDAEFKTSIIPLMQHIVTDFPQIRKALSERKKKLTDAGYHLQVQKSAESVHLFFHDPDRQAIRFDGKMFHAGERNLSRPELLELITSRPFDFSSDVMTRPIVQSYFFPAVMVIGGPAEMAYYAQLFPLFDFFGLVPPQVQPRPSLTLVEARFEKMMLHFNLSLPEIAAGWEKTTNRLMRNSLPVGIEKESHAFSNDFQRKWEQLKDNLASDNPDLSRTFDLTKRKIDFLLKELDGKVFAAHKKNNQADRDKLQALSEHLFPRQALAERSIVPVYFISRYGERLLDFVYENMKIDETGHHLLMLSEYDG